MTVPALSPPAGSADDQAPERRPDGSPVDTVIEHALDRLDDRRRRIRDPKTGRWTFDNGGRIVTGLTSAGFWRDLEPAQDAIVARVKAQLGLTDDAAPETAIGVVEAYAEARLIRRSEFLQLTRLEDEPRTAKQQRRLQDRRRRHLAAWALAFDRELKAALALGLERKAKQLPTTQAGLIAALAAQREARDDDALDVRGPRPPCPGDEEDDRPSAGRSAVPETESDDQPRDDEQE